MSKLFTTLLDAVAANDAAKVAKLIMEDIDDILSDTDLGAQLLEAVIDSTNEIVLELLLSRGLSPDTSLPDGMPPLIAAVQENSAGCVNVLIKNNCNVDAYDSASECTALIWAIQLGRPAFVTVLLSAGADPNLSSRDGMAIPLHLAIEAGSREIVLSLLKAGANPTLRDADGHTPSDRAMHVERPDLHLLLANFK